MKIYASSSRRACLQEHLTVLAAEVCRQITKQIMLGNFVQETTSVGDVMRGETSFAVELKVTDARKS